MYTLTCLTVEIYISIHGDSCMTDTDRQILILFYFHTYIHTNIHACLPT